MDCTSKATLVHIPMNTTGDSAVYTAWQRTQLGRELNPRPARLHVRINLAHWRINTPTI